MDLPKEVKLVFRLSVGFAQPRALVAQPVEPPKGCAVNRGATRSRPSYVISETARPGKYRTD
ncbi:15938_t:CDS:2 [Rhizophagus irregularis]|nr:15938_t:CDS:2 [Rhizophagus irregularis]